MGHVAAEDTRHDGKQQQVEAGVPAVGFSQNTEQGGTGEAAQHIAQQAAQAGGGTDGK